MDFVHPPLHPPHHPPLQPVPKSIRILDLYPSYDRDADIRCRLRNERLSKRLKYKALSYVWGNPHETRPIIVNGARFYVTFNCHAALQRLREVHQTRLWIDAICINQKDDQEKSSQIPLMREIYSSAQEVIVWLGSREDFGPAMKLDNDLAIGLVKDLTRSGHVIGTFEEYMNVANYTNEAELLWQIRRWAALKNIFHHEWFERLWTYQEIAVSFTAAALGDNFFLPWEHLALAASTINLYSDRHYEWIAETQYLSEIGAALINIMRHCEDNMFLPRLLSQPIYGTSKYATRDLSAVELLQITRRYHCLDPRDRVFSAYGLSQAMGKLSIHADYTQSVEQVYSNCIWTIIQSTESLQILSFAGLCLKNTGKTSMSSLELPSWVVDWQNDGSKDSKQLDYKIYRAALDSRAKIVLHNSANVLQLEGLQVDRIIAVDQGAHQDYAIPPGEKNNTAQTFSENKEDSWPTTLFFSGMFETWKRQFTDYPTGCDPATAWIRTITTDAIRHERKFGAPNEKTRLTENILHACLALIRKDDFTWEKIEKGYIELRQILGLPATSSEKTDTLHVHFIDMLLGSIVDAQYKRNFFFTAQGYMGLGPEAITEGDLVCICPGGNVPLLLRKSNDHYILVGECFVWGLMDGEGIAGVGESFEVFNIE